MSLLPWEPTKAFFELEFSDEVIFHAERDLTGDPIATPIGLFESIPHNGNRIDGSTHVFTCLQSDVQNVRIGDQATFKAKEHSVTFVDGDDLGFAIIHLSYERHDQPTVDENDPLSGIT